MSTTNAPDNVSLAVSGKGTKFSIQTGIAAGTVSTSGTGVTGVTGTPFVTGTAWDGLPITIAGVQYTIASVTSSTALVLTTSAGTQTAVAFSGPVTYTAVAELKTLDFSGSKNDVEDVTNFDSAGRAHEFEVTLLDSGEIKIAGNYITSDVGQAAFRAAFQSGVKLSFQMILPLQAGQTVAGETWIFIGAVTELDNTISYDKVLQFSSTVKISGLINVTPGS